MPVKEIETLAQIEEELRSLSRSAADSCRYNERTAVFGKPLFVYLSEVADRIDAAWKRERDELIYSFDPTKAGRSKAPDPVAYAIEGLKHQYAEPGKIDNRPRPVDTCGNNAAMRDALKAVYWWLFDMLTHCDRRIVGEIVRVPSISGFGILDKVRAALSDPPRNCDVGTADEQADRFGKLCIKYYNEEEHCNRKCPLASLDFIHGFPRCQAYWTQMPYESEAAHG